MKAIVETKAGSVRGTVVDGVNVFKGIPYAAAPFGANRLRPPAPAERWNGVRDALEFGPKSPQPSYPPQIALLLEECVVSGEDCLNLNVWSAELGASARQPVLVWIAGGMYGYHGTGGSPWYDGSRFARDGVVCVTFNYRVGIDGFLQLGKDNVNRGLLDQIAALEWVRENIAVFGGDRDNVTIFGESAGAMSVAMLLAMPRAEGLFRRAIAQSGAAHHVISTASAEQVGLHLAEQLGVALTREAIAAVSMDRLLRAQTELEADVGMHPERWGREVGLAMMPWQPVVDGNLIPAPPLERVGTGSSADIDLLIGTNIDEHRMFLATTGMIDQITNEALVRLITAYGLPVDVTLDTYRSLHPRASAGDLFAAVQTDWFWRIPAIRLADAHVPGSASTHMYEFAWRSPQFDGRLGSGHALEIPFVFDTLGDDTTLWGSEPPQQLADTMHAAWVGFARNGECGWPKYDLGRRATMRFDATSKVVDDPRAAERALWRGVR